MITITLPEWFAWYLVILAGLAGVNWLLTAYLSWLKYKLKKLK